MGDFEGEEINHLTFNDLVEGAFQGNHLAAGEDECASGNGVVFIDIVGEDFVLDIVCMCVRACVYSC